MDHGVRKNQTAPPTSKWQFFDLYNLLGQRLVTGDHFSTVCSVYPNNIRRTRLDQRSPRPPEEGVLNCHIQTSRQTDEHGNYMTKTAQWGLFSENLEDCTGPLGDTHHLVSNTQYLLADPDKARGCSTNTSITD